jgi:predicted ATPase/class 3 adenylate cyclase
MAARRPPADLPRGTVTLLFTDIEGSTNALRTFGAVYPEVLARHRGVVREACSRFAGIEVDTQGDAFFFAFGRAADAVAAAAEAQRALAEESWPGGAALRIRMGIHTGEPELDDEGYVGIDLHLAARICAVAHGGQVLLSLATRDLVGDEPVPGGAVRDLGEHRLKDFDRPQRLFQLDAPGLDGEHPPPRTPSPLGLILPSNRLIGRETELAELRRLLAHPAARLVTLTGPGGTGKSRLTLEFAWEAVDTFADGVVLVRLAPVGDSGFVPSAIAAALGVRHGGGTSPAEAVIEYVRDREVLLVLDNMEHLLPASAYLGRLLAEASRIRLLASSRSPLGISGEHVLSVDPLPDADADRLFIERARAADSRFDAAASAAAVREICRRLDGLPLAIELAAARVALLPPAALLERLGLALLSGGPADRPERQRTLRATIDWSYGLLTESQRELHTSLAVFSGGCSLEAIEATQPSDRLLDDLGALVTGSLLFRADAGDEARFGMLQLVRQYALEELERDGRAEQARERHAEWFVGLAEQAEEQLARAGQAGWLDRLERELPNIRAALDWSLSAGRPELALRIASALGRFWRAHGHAGEARAWLAAALEAGEGAPARLQAKALWTAARQASAQSDHAAATPLLEAALALFRNLGDGREEVFVLSELGWGALRRGDLARAVESCEAALAAARALGDPRTVSGSLNALALVLGERGEHVRARALHEEALALRHRLGDDLLVANSAYNLGVAAFAEGDLERAKYAFEECLVIARRVGDDVHHAASLLMLGDVELLLGDVVRAGELLSESAERYRELGDERSRAECLHGLGGVAAALGRPRDAARLWGVAERLRGGGELFEAETAIDIRFRETVVLELGEEGFADAVDDGRRRGVEDAEPLTGLVNPLGPL